MYLTNVHDLSVQPAHTQLGLALKVQLRCNKLTQGPSGSFVGTGNAAHTIKVTTGIPAIPNVVFVRERFLCCWSYELASVCSWEIVHRKTGAEQCCFQPCSLSEGLVGILLVCLPRSSIPDLQDFALLLVLDNGHAALLLDKRKGVY